MGLRFQVFSISEGTGVRVRIRPFFFSCSATVIIRRVNHLRFQDLGLVLGSMGAKVRLRKVRFWVSSFGFRFELGLGLRSESG